MINICLVGTGGIAAQHMKAFAEIGGVHPRWVIASTEEKARSFAQLWRFDQFGADLEAALSDSVVDLVVIASPSERHADQTTLALCAGKNVAVEIPVALSLADVERIIELADEVRRRVVVCHTMRSFPAVKEVRRRVQVGDINLTQIVGHFAIPRRRNQGLSGQARSWVDNLLWHHGCHMVDVALWVLGLDKVEGIHAELGIARGSSEMVMDAVLQFSSPKRQLVTNSLTYNTEQFCWEVRFIGSDKSLTYLNGNLLDEGGRQVLPTSSWIDLIPQNENILESLAQGVPSDYDVRSVLPAMQVLHQAELSASHRLCKSATIYYGAER
jgi:2-hydroxy-4-carboxymuconate semialdehyde hemiacetal dehydrogenase